MVKAATIAVQDFDKIAVVFATEDFGIRTTHITSSLFVSFFLLAIEFAYFTFSTF